ncbi:MAG: hypothetical protein Q9N34_08340 [Aquificota bacterium]|nr:hypothetical protein [Aquificota bacterium]
MDIVSSEIVDERGGEWLKVCKRLHITAPQTADFFKLADALGDYRLPSLEDISSADFYVFVGDDITSQPQRS